MKHVLTILLALMVALPLGAQKKRSAKKSRPTATTQKRTQAKGKTVFGHWALLANCLIYLVQSYQVEEGAVWKICQMTFGVNAIIVLANLVTGGNYGFLRRPPVLGDHGLVLNYFIVTVLMTGTLILINTIVQYSKKRRIPESV